MRVLDTLSVDRIWLDASAEQVSQGMVFAKLAGLLAPAAGVGHQEIESALWARERLRSTGIGEGVAIPHAGVAGVRQHVAALLVSPEGVAFDSIDGRPAQLILGLVGPTGADGEHLRLLARISRLLGSAEARASVLSSANVAQIWNVLANREHQEGAPNGPRQ